MLQVRVTESIVMRTAAFHLHFMSLLSLSQDYKSSSSTMPTFSHWCVQAQDQVQIELAQSPETAWYTAWDTETGPGRIQAIHCPGPKMISCIICQWESDLLSPHGTLEVVTWYLILNRPTYKKWSYELVSTSNLPFLILILNLHMWQICWGLEIFWATCRYRSCLSGI